MLELPHKIHLSGRDYLTVQQIYRGWAWLGAVIIIALLSTLAVTLLVRRQKKIFILNLIALLAIALSLAIFFLFTYPVNLATANWTVLPANWEALRAQWEYSHATNAGLYFMALVALILALLVNQGPEAV